MTRNRTAMARQLAARTPFKSDKGVATVELLIYIVILMILGAAALLVGIKLYDKAHNSVAQQDASAIGTAIQSNYATSMSYPSTAAMAADADTALEDMGAALSDGNEMRGYARTTDGKAFRFCIVHTSSGAWATYDSAQNGLVAHADTGSTCSFTK